MNWVEVVWIGMSAASLTLGVVLGVLAAVNIVLAVVWRQETVESAR